MICPNEDPIFDAVGDLLEGSFRYTRIQLNRYDPRRWPNAEPHRDSKNALRFLIILIGDFQGGAFGADPTPPPDPGHRLTR